MFCNICSSDELVHIGEFENNNIMLCTTCGLMFHELIPSEHEIYSRLRNPDIREFDFGNDTPDLILLSSEPELMLLYGVGDGNKIDDVSVNRFKNTDIHIYEPYCDFSTLGSTKQYDNYNEMTRMLYPVIVLQDLLYKSREPNKILNEVYNLIKSNGCLYIRIPNAINTSKNLMPVEELFDTGNLYFFTLESLIIALRLNGFTGPYDYSYWDGYIHVVVYESNNEVQRPTGVNWKPIHDLMLDRINKYNNPGWWTKFKEMFKKTK